MICPNCSKQISDEASFCGYCGKVITKKVVDDINIELSSSTIVENQQSTENIAKDEKNLSKKEKPIKNRKKHKGLKILIIFAIIAMVAGFLLGLLTAKGVIDLSRIIPSNRFEWTDFSEGFTESDFEETETNEKTDSKDAVDKDSEKEQNQVEKESNVAPSTTENHSKRKLIVGISPDYEPFEFYENNVLKGFDVDLIKLIANELEYEIEFKMYSFDNLVSSVSNGNVDLAISAISITEEHKELVEFTDAYVEETYEAEGEETKISYAIALPKGSLLKKSLNEQIRLLKDNGKIQKLINKYYID